MAISEKQSGKLLREAVSLIRAHSLNVPGMIALGTFGPLAFLFSQILLLLQPLFGWDGSGWLTGGGAALLEDPANVERLISLLEQGDT